MIEVPNCYTCFPSSSKYGCEIDLTHKLTRTAVAVYFLYNHSFSRNIHPKTHSQGDNKMELECIVHYCFYNKDSAVT